MSTLSLTNRVKNLKPLVTLIGIILVATFLSMILKSGCGNNGFDVTTSASMGSGIVRDTVYYDGEKGIKWNGGILWEPSKNVYIDTSKPKTVNHHYKLEGSDTLFQLLWNQVNSPLDVTPRQSEAIKQWLQSGIKIDTTKK